MDELMIAKMDAAYSARLAQLPAKWGGDLENLHEEADELLCLLLRSAGLNRVVDEFEKLGKWYG